MKHTPYGYDIVAGKAVVNEKQAETLIKICENYLSGMSLEKAAKDTGLNMTHSSVKNMMLNRRYLGDDFYPKILTPEIIEAVESERKRRDEKRKGIRYRKQEDKIPLHTEFTIKKVDEKFKDPVKQAEYAYGLIKEVE